jgi:hypothetical protein
VIIVTPSTVQTSFFAPQWLADFDTLRAMTGKSIQPAHASGNVAG